MRLRAPIVLPAAAIGLAFLFVAFAADARDRGADGRFSKRTSSHFVLFQDVDIDESGGLRGSRRFEDQVLATLEGAFQNLDALVGMRPRRAITVTVWDPAIFDARFAGLFRFPAAGFYGDSIHIRGATLVDQPLVRVLHHELVHAAFHAEAPSMVLPAWFNEGTAEWFEARATGNRGVGERRYNWLRNRARAGSLFSLAQLSRQSFAGFDTGAAGAAYLQSYAFIEYLAAAHGERRIRDLVREYLRTGDLERSFRRTFRDSIGDLEARWKRQLAS
jgi:hypothetical protein